MRSKKTHPFNVSELDMRLLVASTLRYSAGRGTYMPSFIVSFINEYYDKFSKDTLGLFLVDLQSMIDQSPPTNYGDRDKAIELMRRIKGE